MAQLVHYDDHLPMFSSGRVNERSLEWTARQAPYNMDLLSRGRQLLLSTKAQIFDADRNVGSMFREVKMVLFDNYSTPVILIGNQPIYLLAFFLPVIILNSQGTINEGRMTYVFEKLVSVLSDSGFGYYLSLY